MKIDKKNWKTVKLGKLAEEISERCDNPSESQFHRFVGLEHFVSGDLTIKQWQGTEDLVSAAKIFKKGDVLFARRNAYLRRASLVEFDGLCSGDALVLRENGKLIVPGFLSLIFNSSRLWDFANANAAGTMSKRVKWRDLANFELLLPPRNEQPKLAELLWAADDLIGAYRYLSSSGHSGKEAILKTIYQNPKCKEIPLADCLVYSQYGISEPVMETGDVPVLRMNNIQNGKLDIADLKYLKSDSKLNIEDVLLQKGDILFNRTNSFELVGKVALFDLEKKMTFASYLIRLRANETIILPAYLNFYLNSSAGQAAIKMHRTPGVSQSNINLTNLKKITIPVVPIKDQKRLNERIMLIEETASLVDAANRNTLSIQKLLINQIFA